MAAAADTRSDVAPPLWSATNESKTQATSNCSDATTYHECVLCVTNAKISRIVRQRLLPNDPRGTAVASVAGMAPAEGSSPTHTPSTQWQGCRAGPGPAMNC